MLDRTDVIIIDDPHADEVLAADMEQHPKWWEEKLADLEARGIKPVVIMTRLHNEDIPGHVLTENLDYSYLTIPKDKTDE